MSEYQYYEFLAIDRLLTGVAMGSPAQQNEGPSPEEMDVWIDALPRDEVKAILNLLLESKGQQAERTLKNRFAAWQRSLCGGSIEAPRCTVGKLRKNAEAAKKLRLEQKKREKKQRDNELRKEREA